jgi:hypothetical protein
MRALRQAIFKRQYSQLQMKVRGPSVAQTTLRPAMRGAGAAAAVAAATVLLLLCCWKENT